MQHIPTKVIKLNSDILWKFIYKHFNSCISRGEFPNELRHAAVISVHKKNCKQCKENYGPVCILSSFSKVYKKNYKAIFIIILKIYFFQVNMVLGKVIVHNTVS